MLWGEIKVDSDDLKHMVHRNGGFIELYNNIMTCLGDLGLLLAVPANSSQWFGPEVGSPIFTCCALRTHFMLRLSTAPGASTCQRYVASLD